MSFYNNEYHIIVISLLKAKQRRERIQNQLLELELDGAVMDAVDADKLSSDELNKRITLQNGFRQGEMFRPGEIACTMSHINALKYARDKKWPFLIVLEDDVILASDFKRRIKYLFKILPNNWNHVYLSGIPRFGMESFPNLSYMHVVQSIFTECTHSMMIRDTAYDGIIDYLSKFETTTDDSYCQLIKNGLTSFTFYPFVSYVLDDYTYIWNHEITRSHKSKIYFRDTI